MLVTLALGKLSRSSSHAFEASLSYMVRLCLKNVKHQNTKKRQSLRHNKNNPVEGKASWTHIECFTCKWCRLISSHVMYIRNQQLHINQRHCPERMQAPRWERGSRAKAPTTKPDDLSSSPRPTQKNWLPQVGLWLSHIHAVTHTK